MGKKIDISEIQIYLVGKVLGAVVGSLLLLFSNFAGFYYTIYEPRAYVWGYIYFGSGVLGSVLILLGIGGLLYSLNFTYRTLKLKSTEANSDVVVGNTEKSMMGGTFTAGLAAIGAIVFAVVNIIEGTQEWWLGGGFYGSFIGGLLIIICGKKIIGKIDPNRKKLLFGKFI